MIYELHPLCTLFPRVTGAEFTALVDDIRANGLRQPIVLHGGMILDGGNRYRACLESGVEPVFTEFDGSNIVSFVLSANLHRRHLSAGQQAAIVASAQDWANAQTVGKPKSGNVATLDRIEDRAAQSGASARTQRMADKVARKAPELAKKVAHGEISLPKAHEQVEGKGKKKDATPLRVVAPSGDVITGEDLGADDPLEMLEELQKENEGLQKQIDTLTQDNTKAELHKMILQRDHAIRQQSEAMDKAHKSQEREKWTKRQLMRCGKAVGEEDPEKIAAAVEAMARGNRKAA
jgi:hypothetical protein